MTELVASTCNTMCPILRTLLRPPATTRCNTTCLQHLCGEMFSHISPGAARLQWEATWFGTSLVISIARYDLQQPKCHIRHVWNGGRSREGKPLWCTVTQHKSVLLVLCHMLFCGAELSDLFWVLGSHTLALA